MATNPRKREVELSVCRHSTYEGVVNEDDLAEAPYEVTNGTSTGELRNYAFHVLSLTKDLYEIDLHVPGDCNHLFYKTMMKEGAKYEYKDGPGVLLVHAHIKSKSEEEEEEEHEEAAGFQSGPAPQPTPASNTQSARRNSLPGSKKPAKSKQTLTNPNDGSSADSNQAKARKKSPPKGKPNVKYIRIGIRSSINPKSKEEIQLDVVAVAAVNVKKETVKYLAVDTWTVTGVQFGDCDIGKEFRVGTPRGFKPDPDFEGLRSETNLKPVLLALLKGDVKRNAKGKNIVPQKLPSTPSYEYTDAPTRLARSTSTKPIVAVVICKDETGSKAHLDFLHNFQVDIDHDETYATFHNSMLEALMIGVLPGGWQLEIWVQPQVRDSTTMYCWTNLPTMVAADWLDAGLCKPKSFGRRLYMEVHCVPKSDKEDQATKTKTKAQTAGNKRKKAVGKAGKVIDDDDEAGDGDTVVKKSAALNAKKAGTKRKKGINVQDEAEMGMSQTKNEKGTQNLNNKLDVKRKKVVDVEEKAKVDDSKAKKKKVTHNVTKAGTKRKRVTDTQDEAAVDESPPKKQKGTKKLINRAGTERKKVIHDEDVTDEETVEEELEQATLTAGNVTEKSNVEQEDLVAGSVEEDEYEGMEEEQEEEAEWEGFADDGE
ncbi:hypothetical protein LTR37_016333 [Vermiconidia calcicola]|uniref:Uncharacterized protein n=1 Tax=Vermiconidia calcicola TaxID=1690605 RepID=A0ACC3MP46_9PEZI|nr:hypothetical protein LTR37_016333 [Vermiconidia calcicola]